MEASFAGLGWQVRLQQKKRQYFFTLAKEVALGNGLRKGDYIFYYLVDCGGRKAILAFLDNSEKYMGKIVKVKGVSFLVK